MSRNILLVFLFLWPLFADAQVDSEASGNWNDPSIWTCDCVPTVFDGQVTIKSGHTITISTAVAAGDILVEGDAVLTIASGGRLTVETGFNIFIDIADPLIPTLTDGRININSGGILENKGTINPDFPTMMVFADNSEYQHNRTLGIVPGATWQAGSTCRITGWNLNQNAQLAFRTSLSQSFHHFIWDCPGQIAGNVQLLGYLNTVNGNLIVRNTGLNRQISLGSNDVARASLTIGGDLIIENNSRVQLAVAAGFAYPINVAGNFNLSTTNAVDYLNCIVGGGAPAGITNLNIAGDLNLNSGQLNLVLINGSGTGNVNVGGNLALNGGQISKAGSGPGTVSFTGNVNHNFTVGAGTFTGGNLNVQAGTLNITGNPLSVNGNITAQSGTTFNMPASLTSTGNIDFLAGSTVNAAGSTLTLTGSEAQTVNANGTSLNNITVSKIIGGQVTLTSPMGMTGALTLETGAIEFISNGNLTLLSTSDGTSGNARIGVIPATSSVSGSVTVQRYMSAEGRLYRYISSPVTNATVAQLWDDFPVSGPFTGSPGPLPCSTCTSNPSLFFYDAAAGEYSRYPVSSATEPLIPGLGYAAFIRQNLLPGQVTIDYSGPINQGSVTLPVVHNPDNPLGSWNLVGNPYPSSIGWEAIGGWTKTNIASNIAVRDNGAGNGNLRVWNGQLGDDLVNGEIAAGQGFWIRTESAAPQLVVNEQAKVITTAEFFRQAGPEAIKFTVTRGDLYDKAYFQVLEGTTTTGVDHYDFPKLSNAFFDLSISLPNEPRMAINAVPELACGQEAILQLSFLKNTNGTYVMNPVGTYVLGFSFQGTLFDGYEVTLKDAFANTETVLAEGGSYSFTVTNDPLSLSENRFKIISMEESRG
jgi:hypothetical protein